MDDDPVRAALASLEAEHARVQAIYEESFKRWQTLRKAIEALREVVPAEPEAVAPPTPARPEDASQPPPEAPEPNEDQAIAPEAPRNETTTKYPILKESVLQVLEEQPRVWSVPELLAEIERRDRLSPKIKRPLDALRIAVIRLAEERRLERVTPGAYRLARSELSSPAQGEP